MWKLNYRAAVVDEGATPPAALVSIGYAPSSADQAAEGSTAEVVTETITSYSKAVQVGSAMGRRFASLGKEVVVEIYGIPVGSDAAGAVQPLPSGAQVEQKYAAIGFPTRDLRHAIDLANETASSGGAVFGTDYGTTVAESITTGT